MAAIGGRPAPLLPPDPSRAGPPRALALGLLLAMGLHAVHGLAMVTVMPVIVRDLGRSSLYGAVLAAYLLASLVGLVWAGRESDRRGLARPFALGMGGFAAGLLASGLAPTMPALVAGRAVEGLGGGALTAVLFATVGRAWPEAMRPRVLAWLAAAWVVPGLLAPPLAGLVAETFGWRPVILGLLPLAGLAALLAGPPLGRLGRPAAVAPERPGAGLGAAAALALGVGLAALSGAAAGSPLRRAALAVPGLVLAAWALRRVLPEGTLRLRRGLPSAIAAKLGFAFSVSAVDAFLPLALTGVHGRSAASAGLAMTLGALSWTTGSFAHAHHGRRLGERAAMLAACASIAAGIGGVGLALSPGAPLLACLAGFALAGFGMGAGTNAASVAALAATPAGREGATSTALGLGDALGVTLATGLGGALLALSERAGHTARALAALWILAALALAAVAVAGWRTRP